MPHEATVRSWYVEDYEGFSTQYARARDIGLDAMADEVLELADDGTNDWVERRLKSGDTDTVLNGEAVARSRLRFDARRWYLSKLAPKRYGDRVNVDHGVQDSLSDLLKEIDGSRIRPGD